MGTINYGTNKNFCSLGYYAIGYYPSDEDIKDYRISMEMEDEEEYSDDYIKESIMDDQCYACEEDMEMVENYLFKNHVYEYFNVSVEAGYYEGFYISIDTKYNYFDSFEDKRKAQKELTILKNNLIKCIENQGIRVCYPGWCTSWEETINDSIKELNNSVKAMRDVINNTLTESQFWKLTKEERKVKYGFCF